MRLPHLDRRIPLERGEAHTVAVAIAGYLARLLSREQYHQPLGWHEVLMLAPLTRLRRRLLTRHHAEANQVRVLATRRRPPKPRLLRVPLEELVALRASLAGVQAAGDLSATAVLGKFHEASTALEAYITFSP